MIFVVLALAWAVYLIPKALAHHDEVAGERLEEGHSEKVRVLTRQKRGSQVVDDAADAPVVETETEVEVERTDVVVRRPARTSAPLTPTARAARNRRRVLGVLLAAVVAVAGLAGASVVPWWSLAVPATLVVTFLVVARLSVRRTQQARRTRPAPATATGRAPVETVEPVRTAAPAEPVQTFEPAPVAAPAATVPADLSYEALELLADPATGREQHAELEAALADEGSLWDPLPLTLPTYVGKATARRTVRTIELTGMTSSGHDDLDSAIARQADEDAERAERSEAAGTDRKVAGA